MFSSLKRRMKSKYYTLTNQRSKYYQNTMNDIEAKRQKEIARKRVEAAEYRKENDAKATAIVNKIQKVVKGKNVTEKQKEKIARYYTNKLDNELKAKNELNVTRKQKRASDYKKLKAAAKKAVKGAPRYLLNAGIPDKKQAIKTKSKKKTTPVKTPPKTVKTKGITYRLHGYYHTFERKQMMAYIRSKQNLGYKFTVRKARNRNGENVLALYSRRKTVKRAY